MHIVNINFQSVKNNDAGLKTLVVSANPDIILGTETWITADMALTYKCISLFQVGAKYTNRIERTLPTLQCTLLKKLRFSASRLISTANQPSLLLHTGLQTGLILIIHYIFSLIDHITKFGTNIRVLASYLEEILILWSSWLADLSKRVTDQHCENGEKCVEFFICVSHFCNLKSFFWKIIQDIIFAYSTKKFVQ